MSMTIELYHFSDMNEEIKQVFVSSRKINVIALNAMFMLNNSSGDKGGFAKITALLREFSRQLDQCIKEMSMLSTSLVSKAAKYKVLLHYEKLIESGLSDPRAIYLKKGFDSTARSKAASSGIQLDFKRLDGVTRKAIKLIGKAEALLLLVKVEACNSAVDKKASEIMTSQLEDSILNISRGMRVCANTIAM